MQIPVSYLQAIHYYYYIAGLLSLLAVFLTYTLFPIFSFVFIILNILHFSVSFYISWVVLGRLKQILIVDMKRYMLVHIILIPVVMGCAALLFSVSFRVVFLYYLLFIDVLLFLAGTQVYIFSHFGIARKVFSFKNAADLNAAKHSAQKLAKSIGLSFPAGFSAYRPGNDRELDSLLQVVAYGKNQRKAVIELYVALCMKNVDRLDSQLEQSASYSKKELEQLRKDRAYYARLVKLAETKK